MYEFARKAAVHLVAQAFNGHVYGVGAAVKINIPHAFGNKRTAEHFVFVRQEQPQKAELLFGQLYAFAAARDGMFNRVHFQIFGRQLGLRGRRVTA